MSNAAAEDIPPHRPEVLMLAFIGAHFDASRQRPIPARIFIEMLDELGVTEGATRRALARMVHKDLLIREVSGRNALFGPSKSTLTLLANGSERVSAAEPFAHREGVWTLLAFTLPESRRDIRHQLRSRLLWAGFGPLRDGLWIASGVVDVEPLLADLPLGSDDGERPWVFTAQPLPPTCLSSLVHRVWEVDRIRQEHSNFLRRWSSGVDPEGLGPMAARALLSADWLRLLRTDPGLPAEHLSADWPAARSARTYHENSERLRRLSDQALAAALGPPALEVGARRRRAS